MNELLNKIALLSKYEFKVGIENSFVTVTLHNITANEDDEDEIVSADDFLRMLENGSPLHNIIATRPFEKTWLEVQNEMMRAYDDCIALIIDKDADEKDIMSRMIFLANMIEAKLKINVDERIRNEIRCKVYYKDAKIN